MIEEFQFGSEGGQATDGLRTFSVDRWSMVRTVYRAACKNEEYYVLTALLRGESLPVEGFWFRVKIRKSSDGFIHGFFMLRYARSHCIDSASEEIEFEAGLVSPGPITITAK